MTRSLHFARLAMALAAATAIDACAPVRVRSYVPRGVRFAHYRTYAWSAATPHATGDPRLDANPFFDERIRSGADRELAARGFERASARPDLLLHYHASVTQKLDVGAADTQYGYGNTYPGASTYAAGTILLDLVDARTNTLVWRAWAEGSLEGVIDDQDWLDERIDVAIARIAATLPDRLQR